MSWQLVAFAVLAAAVLLGGYKVVTAPVITHAALFLAVSFVGVAGLYLLLGAEFVAAVQVLIYGGGIMAVIVFAIMLSEDPDISGRPMRLVERLLAARWGLLPALLAAVVAGAILAVYARGGLLEEGPGAAAVGVGEIGNALFSTYVIPFEVASVLLLAAMLGAIILSRREEGPR